MQAKANHASLHQSAVANNAEVLQRFETLATEEGRLPRDIAVRAMKYLHERIKKEDWAHRKLQFPNEQLPCWQETGSEYIMGESGQILRHLGKKYGFYPTHNKEQID